MEIAAWTTVVLGGARSGKSALAEQLAARVARTTGHQVWYLATALPPDPGDVDWSARIAAHRARRPATWTTVEVAGAGDLASRLLAVPGVALVDSLGSWVVSSSFAEAGTVPPTSGALDTAGARDLVVEVEGLCSALRQRREQQLATVVVGEEVGLGVHPATGPGRRFRDTLGTVTQAVAAAADQVVLVVAGRVLVLPTADEVFGAQ